MTATERKLIDTFKALVAQKGIEAVSVAELTSLAGIPRQNFYKLYTDKFDLAFQIFQQDAGEAIEGIDLKTGFADASRASLEVLKRDLSFYQQVFRDHYGQNSFARQHVAFNIKTYSRLIGRARMTPELKRLVEMWSVGTEVLARRWVLEGAEKSVDWVLEMSHRAMPLKLRELLLSGEKNT